MRLDSDTHSSRYLPTDSLHSRLNSAMPNASISSLVVMPSCFCTSISTGNPWVSQPALRCTW